MTFSESLELQIVIKEQGVQCVRVVGPPELHKMGHELYFWLLDLIDDFDNAVQERLSEGKDEQH